MLKLKKKHLGHYIGGKPVDDEYIPKTGSGRTDDIPHFYVNKRGPGTFDGGDLPGELAFRASMELRRRILRLTPSERTDQDKLRLLVLGLDRDINDGLVAIAAVYTIHGYEVAARMINKWASDRQDRDESILSCYT